MAKKKKVAKRKRVTNIDVNQLLLRNRHLFLMGKVDAELAERLTKEMFALNSISHKPIILSINSPGGSVAAGINIMDTIRSIHSPVVTLISGDACSMAALISVCGDKRMMSTSSRWMIHPMAAAAGDYVSFMKDRMKGIALYEECTVDILKKYTKLTDKEIKQAKHGEIWLTAKECKEKGIVDDIYLREKKK